MEMMGAYFRLQVSKPQSIAWMGAGNPVGQAAWIAERFHDWSDLSAKTPGRVLSEGPPAHQHHALCDDR